jgi:hypothetical protein
MSRLAAPRRRLFVRLRLLSTPHRCDAVTFGYMCHDFTLDGLSPS